MREIIKNTWETYLQFKGVGMHLGLYFAAVLFLNILSKSKKEKENKAQLLEEIANNNTSENIIS